MDRPLIEDRRRALRSAEIELSGRGLDALRAQARSAAADLASRLVDEARAAALDVLGDAEGATAIAAQRMRAGTQGEA